MTETCQWLKPIDTMMLFYHFACWAPLQNIATRPPCHCNKNTVVHMKPCHNLVTPSKQVETELCAESTPAAWLPDRWINLPIPWGLIMHVDLAAPCRPFWLRSWRDALNHIVQFMVQRLLDVFQYLKTCIASSICSRGENQLSTIHYESGNCEMRIYGARAKQSW